MASGSDPGKGGLEEEGKENGAAGVRSTMGKEAWRGRGSSKSPKSPRKSHIQGQQLDTGSWVQAPEHLFALSDSLSGQLFWGCQWEALPVSTSVSS